VARLGVQPGDTVFDFACGTGLNVAPLRRAGAGEIVGIDLSDAMLERARAKHPDVTFLRGDLATIDLGRAAPRVLCTWGLAFVPDVDGGLRNLRRHVAAGGSLVVLDFDRLAGPLLLLRPFLSLWLRAFGARPPLPRAGELGRILPDVVVERIGWGYAVLAHARREPVERPERRDHEPSLVSGGGEDRDGGPSPIDPLRRDRIT
jgi:ubiquinone/menaquinone biosynthesis C-methylase UbiE